CSDHGSKPLPVALGLYCPYAGEPFALTVGTSREPRQPAPGPNHQRNMSSRPLSHRSYGGIDCLASSRITDVSAVMSYRSNAATYRASSARCESSMTGARPTELTSL